LKGLKSSKFFEVLFAGRGSLRWVLLPGLGIQPCVYKQNWRYNKQTRISVTSVYPFTA